MFSEESIPFSNVISFSLHIFPLAFLGEGMILKNIDAYIQAKHGNGREILWRWLLPEEKGYTY
jgi:hypothetical protein